VVRQHRSIDSSEPQLCSEPQLYATGSWPVSTAIADVTGDGRNDVLLTTRFSAEPSNDYKLFLFPQAPDGSLGAPTKLDTHGEYNSVHHAGIDTGDIDDDGDADAVVATSKGVDLYHQIGGTLVGPTLIPTDLPAQQALIADLSGDGTPDLVADTVGTDEAPGEVIIFPGDGDNFGAPVTLTDSFQTEIEIGDVTGDGRLDIVGCDNNAVFCSTATLNVFEQQGDGSFLERRYPAPVLTWNVICHLGIGDVTGDGRIDVLASICGNQPGALIDVFPQRADGSLAEATPYHVYDLGEPLETADIDSDGLTDVITLHDCHVGVLLQQADGTLDGAEDLYRKPCASHNTPKGLAVGDVSSDGLPDVVEAKATGSAADGALVMLQVPASSGLSLQTDASSVAYQDDVQVTVHVGDDVPGTHVEIFETSLSGTTLLGEGDVGSGEAFTMTVPGHRDVVFRAEAGSLASNEKLLLVHARVKGSLRGSFSSSGKYRLFRYRSSCPTEHQGCPRYSVRVEPNHASHLVHITIQAYRSGTWETVRRVAPTLSSTSTAAVRVVYRLRDRNVRMRVRACFTGDVDHLGSGTAWSCLRIVA
jgi:hypothetical protein